MTFSPDGKQMASGSYEEIIRLWDTATGSLQQTLEDQQRPFERGIGGLCFVTFSPDGKQIVSGFGDGTIRLWDAATGNLQWTFEDARARRVNFITFSLDGKQLASSFMEKTVKLYDAATGSLQRTFDGYENAVRSVAFSPDGRYLKTDDEFMVPIDDGTNAASLDPQSTPEVFVRKGWAMRGTQRVLRLPFEYRASRYAVQENLIALGQHSGQVTFLELDFALLYQSL